MEENVNEVNTMEQPVETPEVPTTAEVTPEVQVIDGFSNAVATENVTEMTVQPEFASATAEVVATEVVPTEAPVQGTPLKPKKKVNKTLIIVLIFLVVFGGAMLLMKMGNNGNGGNNQQQGEEQTEVKVNTGSDWGNKYLSYMMEYKPDLKNYEISFIDVDFNETPEMLVKYVDNSEKESLIILYIAEDGFVYETKYYRDYKIRLIYSLKDKKPRWYIFITTTKHYGTFTEISKIINKMAFDADIKATNDSLMIDYGKKYYDTDYQPIFYNIKENSQEQDFKDFVFKYEGYNEDVNELITKTDEKYKDYQYVEDAPEQLDTIGLSGRSFKCGTYLAEIPADPATNTDAYTAVIVLYDDGTISVDGKLYTYSIVYEKSYLDLGDDISIDIDSNNTFGFRGHLYKYVK